MKLLLQKNTYSFGILIILSSFLSCHADWFNTTSGNLVIPNNSYLEMRDYILNTQFVEAHYGNISGSINLAPIGPIPNNSMFDVFLLYKVEDMICYKEVVITQNYNKLCSFLTNPNVTLLNQTQFSLQFLFSNFTNYNMEFMYYVLDNTEYPTGGAYPTDDIPLSITYSTYVEPTKNYVRLILILGILLGCLLLISLTCVLFCLYRYRKLEAEHNSNKLNSARPTQKNVSFAPNTISFSSSHRESIQAHSVLKLRQTKSKNL